MVITTQAGRSYLAGMNTGYCIKSDPDIKKDGVGYVISEGCHLLGTYDSMDRARKVAHEFKKALDDGAQAFNFPAK